MKKGIHPVLKTVTIKCACGSSFQSKSTSENLVVDLCFMCHPLYTGNAKNLDVEGRLQKYMRLREIAQKAKESKK